MIFIKKIFLIVILVIIATAATGCVKFKTNQKDTSAIDGGVFRTMNKGGIWKQKVLIPAVSGRPNNFAGVNVSCLVMDPGDHKAVYFGSEGNGLFYTYNRGDSWQKTGGLGNATIRAVAVDSKSKCVIYAAIGNKAYKSIDCSRSWAQVYLDNEPAATVNAIAIDHYNSSIIYIGVSRGDIIKSVNGGKSWQTIHRIKAKIKNIVIDPNDSRIIYVITATKGIFRTKDSGDSWTDFNGKLRELKLGLNIRGMILVKNEPGIIFMATAAGIIKSVDQGGTWEKIELIPPEKKASINAIAVNPRDLQEIYYVTNTTFNRSLDGGENWAPTRLPTSRAGSKLLIDPEDPQVIYMGVRGGKK